MNTDTGVASSTDETSRWPVANPVKVSGDTEVLIFHSTADEVASEGDHHFSRTNPRSVLLLATGAAVGAVLTLAAVQQSIETAIDADLIAPPPALQPLVGQDQ